MKPGILIIGTWILGCAAQCSLGQIPSHLTLEALKAVRLPDVAIESATHVEPDRSKNAHAASHVQLRGVIGGTIRFELLLPDAWNEGFVMGGGGGFVGTVQNSARDSVNRGYATSGTDTGHEWEPGYMGGWALNNLEAQLNFGYLAVHRTAEVSKALIRAYYRKDAAHAYFLGCSRGGGQAMMEAQRYPRDFDGIVAGAPAFNWTGFAATMVSIAKALYPDPKQLETNVLNRAALQTLHDAILEQCDAQDGLKDGVIQDPASVHFDLSQVQGITPQQREAIAAIYNGARNSRGQISVGYPQGAECDPDQWIAWLVGPVPSMVQKDQVPDLTFAFGTQVFKYLIFNQPDWDYSTYDFSTFDKDSRLAASFLNATDPNLDGFKAHKGKLILWHGWADPALPAQATADYYHQVQLRDPHAGEYCRLFLIPGCLHCGGGPGAADVDWLSVITDWVEKEKAPDMLIASKREGGQVVFTRPLFPYPEYASYKGSGDTHKAENFVAKSTASDK
ncbi:MAG TPA: tannase/feruloyl esterase family alpha/beta hydrolase [Verrucomicrobiae bacterium]|nr:tannase/feruloyl esterase family alpha/beta hydrolase [Verrucomicrobiae bacterium]